MEDAPSQEVAPNFNRLKLSADCCAVQGCDFNLKRNYCKNGIKCHFFPKNELTCTKWIEFCQNPCLDQMTPTEVSGSGYYICSQHFSESDSKLGERDALLPTFRPRKPRKPYLRVQNSEESNQVQPSTTAKDIPTKDIASNIKRVKTMNDCAVQECDFNRYRPYHKTGVKCHNFPTGDTMCAKWREFCQNPQLTSKTAIELSKSYFVCSQHFADSDYILVGSKYDALPTLMPSLPGPISASFDPDREKTRHDCAVLQCDYNKEKPYYKLGIMHLSFPKDILRRVKWKNFCENPRLNQMSAFDLCRKYFICSQHFSVVVDRKAILPSLRTISADQEQCLGPNGEESSAATVKDIPNQNSASNPETESLCPENDCGVDEEQPLIIYPEPTEVGLEDTNASDSEGQLFLAVPKWKTLCPSRSFPTAQEPDLGPNGKETSHVQLFEAAENIPNQILTSDHRSQCSDDDVKMDEEQPLITTTSEPISTAASCTEGLGDTSSKDIACVPNRKSNYSPKVSADCSVLECDYNRNRPYHKTGIKRHFFPTDKSLCDEWKEFCQNPQLNEKTQLHKSYFICSQHFSESDFMVFKKRSSRPTIRPSPDARGPSGEETSPDSESFAEPIAAGPENTTKQDNACVAKPKRQKLASDCAVLGCDYNRKPPNNKTGINCHFFPTDEKLCAEWKEFCRDPQLKDKTPVELHRSFFVCSQHFSVVTEKRVHRPSLRPSTASQEPNDEETIQAQPTTPVENIFCQAIGFDPKRVKPYNDCAVLECDYNRKQPYYKSGISCYSFPLDDSLCDKWTEFCQDPRLKDKAQKTLRKWYFICSQHFAESDFVVVSKRATLPTLMPIQPSTSADISSSFDPNRVKTAMDCAVSGCDYNKEKPYYRTGITHHSFPLKAPVFAKWMRFCKNPHLKDKTRKALHESYFICSQHFSLDQERRPLSPTLRLIPASQEKCSGSNGEGTSQVHPTTSAQDIPILDITSDHKSQHSDDGYGMDEVQSLTSTPEPSSSACLTGGPEDIPSQEITVVSEPKRMKTRDDCAVFDCDYNWKEPYHKTGVDCHFFPTDRSLYVEWIEFCQNPRLKEETHLVLQKSYFICSQHFAESDYLVVGKNRALYPTLIPSFSGSTSRGISPAIDSNRMKSSSDCSVMACDYNIDKPYYRTGIEHHYFPKNLWRDKWIKFCQNPHLKDQTRSVLSKNYFICSQHFSVVANRIPIRPTLRSISAAQEPCLVHTNNEETSLVQPSTPANDIHIQDIASDHGMQHSDDDDNGMDEEALSTTHEPVAAGLEDITSREVDDESEPESQHFYESIFIVDKKEAVFPTLGTISTDQGPNVEETGPVQASTTEEDDSIQDITSVHKSQHCDDDNGLNAEKMLLSTSESMAAVHCTKGLGDTPRQDSCVSKPKSNYRPFDCAVLECDFNRRQPYHKSGTKCRYFPADRTLCDKWKKFCQNPYLTGKKPTVLHKSHFICSQHFSDKRAHCPSLRSIPADQGPSSVQNYEESSRVQPFAPVEDIPITSDPESQHFSLVCPSLESSQAAQGPGLDPNGEETSQDQPSEAAENIPSQNIADESEFKRVKTKYDCSVLECDYNKKCTYHKKGVKCHYFPREQSLCAEWLEFCQEPRLKDKTPMVLHKYYFVCSQHFSVVADERALCPSLRPNTADQEDEETIQVQPTTPAKNIPCQVIGCDPKRFALYNDCAVLNCDYNRNRPYYKIGIKCYPFPIDESLCAEWIEFCQNPRLKAGKTQKTLRSIYFICSQHFAESDFVVVSKRATLPTLRPIQPSTSADISSVFNSSRERTKMDCAVLQCDYNRKKPYYRTGIKHVYFPIHEYRFAKWIEFCQNPHLKGKERSALYKKYFICSQHFSVVKERTPIRPSLRTISAAEEPSLGRNNTETSSAQPSTSAKNIPIQDITSDSERQFSDDNNRMNEERPLLSTPEPIAAAARCTEELGDTPCQDIISKPKRSKFSTDCAVLECDYNLKRPYHKTGIKKHYFPITNESLCSEWIEFCRNPLLKEKAHSTLKKTYFICSQHFLVVDNKRTRCPSLRPTQAALEPFLDANSEETSQVQPSTTAEDIPIQEMTSGHQSQYSDEDCGMDDETLNTTPEQIEVGLEDTTSQDIADESELESQHFDESSLGANGQETYLIQPSLPEDMPSQDITHIIKRVKTRDDCAVLECDYNRKRPYYKTGIKHRSFPRDKSMFAEWREFCQNPQLKDKAYSTLIRRYFICSQHFDDSDFIVTKKGAVCPTLRPMSTAPEPYLLGLNGEDARQDEDVPILEIASNPDSESLSSEIDCEMDEEQPPLSTPESVEAARWIEGLGDVSSHDIASVSKPKRPKLASDCAIFDCDYNRSQPYYKTGIEHRSFPKDESLCAEWIEFCQNPCLKDKTPIELSKSHFICSQHFDVFDFIVVQKKPNNSTLRPISKKTSKNVESEPKRVKSSHDCAVLECDYNRRRPYHKTGIKHRSFPKDESLCAEWIDFCQNPRLRDKTYLTLKGSYFICSQHFDESDFIVGQKGAAVCPSLRPICSTTQEPSLVQNNEESSPDQPSTSAEDILILDITSDPESSESDFVGHNTLVSSISAASCISGSKGNRNRPIKTYPSAASKRKQPRITIDDIEMDPVREDDPEMFLKSTAIEISKIYANPELNRKCANETIDLMVKIRSSVEQNNVLEAIRHMINTFCLADVALNLKNELKMMTDPWHNSLSTEEKRMDLYKQMGTLPEIFRLNPDFATLDIECVVRNFLQMPGVLDSIEKEHSSKKKTSDAVLDSFLKGDIWQEKESNFDENFLTIPLALYFVSIGSSGSSNLAVFLTFPSLPNGLLSSEENNFLVGLIGGDCATIDTFLQKLVTALRSLLRGLITMEVNGQIRRVQFCLAFALGTKDGLQQFLGLKQDCLFCSESSEIETKPLLIPSVQYSARDFSCQNFELHRDVIPDFSEDWLLKICIWNLNLVFVEVIPEKVSLSVANERLRMFEIRSPEKQNLAAHGLEGVGCWLESLTEEEVQRLVCFLPFVFADHIPKSDSQWMLFMELREIVFGLLGSIRKKDIPKLSSKIVTYLTKCKEFFQDGTLPNYFHAASHYPNAYEKFGPFEQFLTIRRAVRDKICQHLQKLPVDLDKDNLVEAYSWKQQMVVNERFLSKRGASPESEIGPELPLSPALIKQFDIAAKYLIEELKRVEHFTWQGEKFLPNSIVISGYVEEHLQFAQIQHILSSTAGDICLCLCFRFKTACFDKHYGSYRVVDTEEPEIVDLLQLEWKCPVQQIFTQDGSNFILLNKAYQWNDSLVA